MQKIVDLLKLQNILFFAIVATFVFCLFATLIDDIPYIDLSLSISDLWTAYSGISIPMTFFLFVLKENQSREDKRTIDRETIYSSIKLFLDDFDAFIEHLKSFYLNIDISIASSLKGLENKTIFHDLLLYLFQLGKLTPNDTDDHRKNYLMRLKLDQIIALILHFHPDSNITYEVAKTKHVNKKLFGDEDIEAHTMEIYQKQLQLLSSAFKRTNRNLMLTEIVRQLKE